MKPSAADAGCGDHNRERNPPSTPAHRAGHHGFALIVEGVFLQRGKTSGDAATVVFQGGRFRSQACDRYGYSDAAYSTTTQGDYVTFEAQTESTKYGRLLWKGVIHGDQFSATATMVRQGKPPVENWVVAATKQ